MSISDISSVLEKYGIKGGIFVIIIFLLITMIKSSWFSNLLSKVSDKLVETFDGFYNFFQR